MKRLLIASLTLILAGCGYFGGGGSASNEELIARLQAATVDACAFLPSLSSVAALVGAFDLTAGSSTGAIIAAGGQICEAIGPMLKGAPMGEPKKMTITVNGKVIEIDGVFVSPKAAPEPKP